MFLPPHPPLSHDAHGRALGTVVLNGTLVRATQKVKRNHVVHREIKKAVAAIVQSSSPFVVS